MADEIDNLIDELTTEARRTGEVQPQPSPQPPRPSESRRWKTTVAIAFGLAVFGIGGFWLGSRLTDETVAAPARDEPSAGPAVNEVQASSTSVAVSPPSSVAPEGLSTTTQITLPLIGATEDNPQGAIRYTVYSGGKIYMRGFARSQEEADAIVGGIEAAVGPDIVVNELEINPATPESVENPVYFEDAILFDLGSAEIQPEFQGLLNLVPLFLNPAAGFKLTVVAKTDATGSEEYNLQLATNRAEAIVDYLTGIGVDPSLLATDPRGEAEAIETDDPEQAAQQRRVEFVFTPVTG